MIAQRLAAEVTSRLSSPQGTLFGLPHAFDFTDYRLTVEIFQLYLELGPATRVSDGTIRIGWCRFQACATALARCASPWPKEMFSPGTS